MAKRLALPLGIGRRTDMGTRANVATQGGGIHVKCARRAGAPIEPGDAGPSGSATSCAGRSAGRRSSGEPLPGADRVSAIIMRFSPRRVTVAAWARAEGVVREIVTVAAPDSPPHAEQQLSVVAQLALWADRLGQPLEARWLLSPEVIDRFIVDGCAHLSKGTRLNYRTQLRRIGQAVLGPEAFPERPVALQRSTVRSPYDRIEVADLVSWSRGLPTEHMRRNVLALLAIGLGAGLTSDEIRRLTGTDVRVDQDTVLVEVRSGRPRSVPVHQEWAGMVLELARESGTSPFFLPDRRRVTRRDILALIERASGDGPPRFNIQRLRVTWIVDHLSAGVHLHALAQAAGVEVAQLVKYYGFVAHPDRETARRQLVGGP